MDGDIGSWVSSIPLITRYWFFSFLVVPLTTRLGLIDPLNLVLIPDKVLGGFQVFSNSMHNVNGSSSRVAQRLVCFWLTWTLLIDMAAADVSSLASSQFQLADDALFPLQLLSDVGRRFYSKKHVPDIVTSPSICFISGYFAGRPADYLFMLLCSAICINVSQLFKMHAAGLRFMYICLFLVLIIFLKLVIDCWNSLSSLCKGWLHTVKCWAQYCFFNLCEVSSSEKIGWRFFSLLPCVAGRFM